MLIEKVVQDYLNERIKAYMEAEKDMPNEYVIIEKTGSGGKNFIENSTVAIQSFSTSLVGAAELNEKVKEIMKQITELNEVSKCELNSDYNNTDTSKKQYRYQAVFDIVHY